MDTQSMKNAFGNTYNEFLFKEKRILIRYEVSLKMLLINQKQKQKKKKMQDYLLSKRTNHKYGDFGYMNRNTELEEYTYTRNQEPEGIWSTDVQI